ncbi:MAG: hypothetical protein KDH17_21365 [Rhodocyclaceae bacterium]|nr:hypothetical protein [Rhodocyclaceae bacterium]
MGDIVERLLFPVDADSDEAGERDASARSIDGPALEPADDELILSSRRKLTLRCGKASITLYPSGKIVLRGEYILSDAEGVNRINGGRIELN